MRVVGLTALLLVGACPQPPVEEPPDAGVVALASESYCESIVDFFCPFYLRCDRVAAQNEAECERYFLETCNARFEPSFTALERAGMLRMSDEGIEACRAHLQTVACDQHIRDLDGPCAAIWTGAQEEGEACGFDLETFVCAPGTQCVLDLTLCGVCEREVEDGAACTAQGLTCRRESFCDSVCVPRKKVGEACTPDDRCVFGAVCGDGVCGAPSYVAVGEACNAGVRCPFGSRCLDGLCHESAALGEDCDAFARCDSGFCGDDGVCVALAPQGGACDEDLECQTGACEDDGVCTSLPSICLR